MNLRLSSMFLASAKTPLALVLMAVFAQFPVFHDTRLDSLGFNPLCLTEGFAPFFRRPFPDGLAVAYFPAFASVSVRLDGRFVGLSDLSIMCASTQGTKERTTMKLELSGECAGGVVGSCCQRSLEHQNRKGSVLEKVHRRWWRTQDVATNHEYRNIPSATLVESPTNPRKRFDEMTLGELAASFKQGSLGTVAGTPLKGSKYEVVIGARRLKAARLAELESVPVRVAKLTDAEAIEARWSNYLCSWQEFSLLIRSAASRLDVNDVPIPSFR